MKQKSKEERAKIQEEKKKKELREMSSSKKPVVAQRPFEIEFDRNGRVMNSELKHSTKLMETNDLVVDCSRFEEIAEAKEEETPLLLPEWARNPFKTEQGTARQEYSDTSSIE